MVLVLELDRWKISIERTDDNNFKILCDNKPFFVSIKTFCGLMKKGKDLTKNKYIKIKNRLDSAKLWDVFSGIEGWICQEAQSIASFADATKVLLECDQRLPLNRLIYSEDCIIFFDQVLTNVTENYDYIIDCKVIKSAIFAWWLTFTSPIL